MQTPADNATGKNENGAGTDSLAILKENEETEKEKKERLKKEKLVELGGPASLRKMFSLASLFELTVFGIGIFGTLLHGAGQPLLCVLMGDLIDAVGRQNGTEALAGMNITAAQMQVLADQAQQDFMDNIQDVAVRCILIGAAVFCCGALQAGCLPWFADAQLRKMRPLYFDIVIHRDVGWFETQDVGALVSEMETDLHEYADGFGSKFGTSLMSSTSVIYGFLFGFFLCWEVALAMCVTLPLMALGAGLMGKAMMETTLETQGAYAKAARIVDEVLSAVRTVVSFGGEKHELARYTDAVEVARKGGLNNRIKSGLGMGFIWFMFLASMGFAFWCGMKLVYDGRELTVGSTLSAFYCIVTAGFVIGQIPPGMAAFLRARTSCARFFHLKGNESVIMRRPRDDRKAVKKITTIELRDVSFKYPARPGITVLDGLSLTITKGQKVAFVGESGSGKSTVMALLERFYDPCSGAVLVNGEDLKNFSVASYRSHIGYVGQEPVLFATSVRDNIMQGCAKATQEAFQKAADNANLEFVDDLEQGFDTYVGSGGPQFSGGQKQRIAIARALVKNPSILFFDEATSALDSASERMVQGTLDEISESSGITMVSIARRISTVKNFDVLYVMSQGKVAEFGSHDQLFAMEGGLYRGLLAAQEVGRAGEKTKRLRFAISSVSTTSVVAATEQPDEDEAEKNREKKINEDYKVPMKRVMEFSRPQWWALAPGFLAALVSGACFPVLAVYFLVDAIVGFQQDDKEVMKRDVERAVLGFVLVAAAKCAGTFLTFACFGLIGEATTKQVRVRSLTAIFRQEIGFHDDPEHTSGKLLNTLGVQALRIARLSSSFGDKADAMCSILVGVTLALMKCWEMALAVLVSIPLFGIAQSIEYAATMGGSLRAKSCLKTSSQTLADALKNMRTVHAAGCEKDLAKLYKKIVAPASKDINKTNLVGGLSFGFSQGILFVIVAAGFWFMGFLIKEGRTTFADAQSAFLGLFYASLGAGVAMTMTGDLRKAKVAAHDMFKLLDRESSINGLESTGTILKSDAEVGRIEFDMVEFAYPFRPDRMVLKAVSFAVPAGQSVGVVGPSGGGKSTLMAMIQRFYDPKSGSVFIGRERLPLDSLDIRWWRKQVGYVGQEPILFDGTVLENVTYGLEDGEEFNMDHLEECKKMAHLGFIDDSRCQGWDTQVGPRGSRLSGGQKQRLAICRTLVRNPPIMLLDEATSALDKKSEAVVRVALEAARAGRTSFAIAHRLSMVQGCDTILVVSGGRIVEWGPHAELMAQEGVYYDLQKRQGH